MLLFGLNNLAKKTPSIASNSIVGLCFLNRMSLSSSSLRNKSFSYTMPIKSLNNIPKFHMSTRQFAQGSAAQRLT